MCIDQGLLDLYEEFIKIILCKNGLNYADVILAWSLIEKNALEMLSMT